MRILFYLIFCLGLIVSNNATATNNLSIVDLEENIVAPPLIVFGTKSHPCDSGDDGDDGDDGKDCYCTGSRGICLIIKPKMVKPNTDINDLNLNDEQGVAEAYFLGGSVLELKIIVDNAFSKDSEFVVNNDVKVYDENNNVVLKIHEGVYNIDYSENDLGSVRVNYSNVE